MPKKNIQSAQSAASVTAQPAINTEALVKAIAAAAKRHNLNRFVFAFDNIIHVQNMRVSDILQSFINSLVHTIRQLISSPEVPTSHKQSLIAFQDDIIAALNSHNKRVEDKK